MQIHTLSKAGLLAIAMLLNARFAIHSQTAPVQDIGWPRQIVENGATLVYYQPQVQHWKNFEDLQAEMAFSLTPKGGSPVLGVASLDANTLTDKEAHTVYIRNVMASDVRFPSLGQDSTVMMTNLFKQLMPGNGETISLDRVLADMNQVQAQRNAVPLKMDPPPVFYSTTPAIILMVEGDSAVQAPIQNSSLSFVVNTNWDLFFDQKTKHYYLLAQDVWLSAPDYKGPWKKTSTLPADINKLPAGENFDEVKKMIPPRAGTTAPKVFFTDQPSELILVNGAPVYSKITGTNLLYVTNTESDVFLDNTNRNFYVLLSGRWYRANTLEGPWTFSSNEMPADFSKIPATHLKAHVLASVPGTVEASDAVLLAQVPSTAIVNKAAVEAKVKVQYSGEPQFKPIETTSLQYAVNTTSKVIQDKDRYYLCDNAVWFQSSQPTGPWKVANMIPAEIYSIPSTSPVYNLTYVKQTNATDSTVESSYTAGYMGMFIFGATMGACLAYGTGWYYPPFIWWGPGMLFPFYNPWPCAWGAGFIYNPWMGGWWGVGPAFYGPYAVARSSAWYNPATGRYGHASSVQGWYNGRTNASVYNPWTGGYAATHQGHSPYAQWGTSVAGRGDQWVRTGHISTANGTAFGVHTSGGRTGVIGPNGTKVVNGKNGTFAGHDGNIYRRDPNGNWNKYDGSGRWKNSGSNEHLNRWNQSRQRGQMQTQRFQHAQRSNMGAGRFRGGFRH